MHPSFALVTHDPLLSIICGLEIDLLAVEAVKLLFVLLDALRAQILNIVLVVLIVLCMFVQRAYLIAADIIVARPDFLRRRLAGLRLQQFLCHLFF